jgi:hypothetical protein
MDYQEKYLKYKQKYFNLKNLYLSKTLVGGVPKVRPSPSESATLFNINTKKKGNNVKTWIVTKNKNNVKKWKLYKDPKMKSSFDLGIEQLYPTKPVIKKHNWKKWLENSSDDLIKLVNKIRDSFTFIKKIGLKVIEVVEAPDSNNHWIVQYPIDYTRCNYPELYKDSDNIVPHFIIIYKINNDSYLITDYLQECIQGLIHNMSTKIKEKLVKYLDINFNEQYHLTNNFKNDYILTFCVKNPNIKVET